MNNHRPGLTGAVLDATDLLGHATRRGLYDYGRPASEIPVAGNVLVCTPGTTNFQPLGMLAADGIRLGFEYPDTGEVHAQVEVSKWMTPITQNLNPDHPAQAKLIDLMEMPKRILSDLNTTAFLHRDEHTGDRGEGDTQ